MKKIKKSIKFTILIALTLSILALLAIAIANFAIGKATDGLAFDNVEGIPHKKVGLLLGTSRYVADGRNNVYFWGRINAAAELYKAGKVDYLIVSGDNRTHSYNEPVAMQQALIEKGVPAERMYLDYAGFRTYDSIVRADKIFGQKDFIVISQEFHNRRAIYIANKVGLKAIGYNAEGALELSTRVRVREALARVKVFIDLFTGARPKFLGEKIEVGAEKPTFPIGEEEAKEIIGAKTKEAIGYLKAQDAKAFSKLIHPEKGVRLSPYAYVDPAKDVVMTSNEFAQLFKSDTKRAFGAYDGTGEPIELTGSEYFEKFIYTSDFADAEEVSYNRTIGQGNSLENQFEVYPESIIVEHYFSGFEEEYAGMDWESLRLVFEWRNADWRIVGIIHNQWTI